MRVRFHDECDCCGEPSQEYTPWLMCRECGGDVCPDCATDVTEPDEGDRGTGLCRACGIEAAREQYWDDKIQARIDGDWD